MREVNSISRRNALALNGRNSLPCTVRTSRQPNGWLSDMVKISEGDWSANDRLVRIAKERKFRTPSYDL